MPEAVAPPAASSDPWTIWFMRLVQVVGLASFPYEVIVEHSDRPWVFLTASAMMLGSLGLQLAVRAILRIGGEK